MLAQIMKNNCDNIWRIFGLGSMVFKMGCTLGSGRPSPENVLLGAMSAMRNHLCMSHSCRPKGWSIGRRIDLFCI
jgi:hypothetical protein